MSDRTPDDWKNALAEIMSAPPYTHETFGRFTEVRMEARMDLGREQDAALDRWLQSEYPAFMETYAAYHNSLLAGIDRDKRWMDRILQYAREGVAWADLPEAERRWFINGHDPDTLRGFRETTDTDVRYPRDVYERYLRTLGPEVWE